ncbi:MAG: sporulation protein YqfD [Oscillospiraceae bacterium]|nr:sporulation protein YqfD [Oscillospiraceae bacterium]
MDLWRSISGMVDVSLTSADPGAAMQAINGANIEVFNARQEGELTLRFTLHRNEYRQLRVLMERRGERLELSRRSGLYWAMKQVLRRPVLVLGIALMLFLTLYLPSRVLFVEVDGNVQVPAKLVLEKAEQCGIGFGSARQEVRSERMKNALLQAIPQLQWAGINTYGCRAVISVRERPAEEQPAVQNEVCSIVAARDGIIKEVTVRNGNRVCQVGQAVRAGQVLISGYTDCGIAIRATRAEGEVFAETQRQLDTVLPLNYVQKREIIRQEKKFSLLIGKKQINFSKDSGISTATCDKMYSVNYIMLPGGFQLPIAWITETVTIYETEFVSMDAETAQPWMTHFSDRYLIGAMNAGQIQNKSEQFSQQDDLCVLHGRYACVEMIGKTQLEENLLQYEQAD